MVAEVTQDAYAVVTFQVGALAGLPAGRNAQQNYRYPKWPIMRAINWEMSFNVDHGESLAQNSSHFHYFTEPTIIIGFDMSMKLTTVAGTKLAFAESNIRCSVVGLVQEFGELFASLTGEPQFQKNAWQPFVPVDIFLDTGDYVVPYMSMANVDPAQDTMGCMCEFAVYILEKQK